MFRRLLSPKSKSSAVPPANTLNVPVASQAPRASEAAQPMQNPVVIVLKPDGSLRAFVYTHEMSSSQQRIFCWTYISEGLAALGQTEVVFTIRRKQGEAPQNYPPGPLNWFGLLYSFAQQGQFANDDYSITQFSAQEFLGRTDIGMIVYTRPQPLGDLPANALPKQYLQALPLTHAEKDVSVRFGALRVLSQLGRSVSYFPYPPWFDTERKTVISPANLSESILGKCATVSASGVSIVKEGDDIRLSVRPRAGQRLVNSLTQVPPQMPFAILSQLSEDSDSCLIWRNGQREPAAIGTSMNRTNLCFLVICPQQPSNVLKLTEDGYSFLLTDHDWGRIHESIVACQSLTLPAAGGRFHLEMMSETYHNPVDGRLYTAPGGWRDYHPQNPQPNAGAPPAAGDNTHLQLKQVVLLTNPSPQECDAGVLAAHVKNVTANLASSLPPTNPLIGGWGKAMIVQLDVVNGAVANVQCWLNPNSDGVHVETLQASVRSIPIPGGVRSIVFQMFFDIWGGLPTQPGGH